MTNSLCLVSIRFNNSQFNEHWNKHSYAEVQKKTKKYFSRMEVLLVLWYMHNPYRSDQNTVCKCWLTSNTGSQHAVFPKNKGCHFLWVAILSLSQKSSWYSLLCYPNTILWACNKLCNMQYCIKWIQELTWSPQGHHTCPPISMLTSQEKKKDRECGEAQMQGIYPHLKGLDLKYL